MEVIALCQLYLLRRHGHRITCYEVQSIVVNVNGARVAPPRMTSEDPVSGATVRQLTSYRGHSSHFYFTNPCWYDQDRRMLFLSDRENRTNLFSVELESGEIMQLTDVDPSTGEIGGVSVNPVREEAYFDHGDAIMALDLESLDARPIYTRPEGFVGGGTNVTAGGEYICTGCSQDLSDQYLMTYCHEGPWDLVENRIWGLDLSTGETCQARQISLPYPERVQARVVQGEAHP